MNKPTIANNKPIPVELKAGDAYYFCTCGKSAKQPFCDGSHKGTSFAPKSFVAEEDGEAYLCQCKQTAKAPFCDGKHAKVPEDQVGKEFTLKTNQETT
ncbi:MAG: CDGSH-type Zn-finger protein [Candidatus Promineifilaceae bacterium]